MNEAIIVALIAGGISLVGTIITVQSNNQKIIQEMKSEISKEMHATREEFTKELSVVRVELAASKAATDTRLDDLTQEVRKHNGFADRIPRVETEIKGIKDKIEYLHKN